MCKGSSREQWLTSVMCWFMQEATCCDDHEHCCPSNLPVCDTVAGRCLSGNEDDWESSVPWVSKVPLHCGHMTCSVEYAKKIVLDVLHLPISECPFVVGIPEVVDVLTGIGALACYCKAAVFNGCVAGCMSCSGCLS